MPVLSHFYRFSTTLFVAVYLAFQLIIPLRHYIYPGNVSWTEEGHRFSWRMKLNRKAIQIVFNVTDPNSHRSQEIPRGKILNFLTHSQYLSMSGRPDMILQFSHYLAERFHEKGYPGVEVRAHVLNSLNGRPLQTLIDPDIDLAKVKARLWPPAPWILPLNEEK